MARVAWGSLSPSSAAGGPQQRHNPKSDASRIRTVGRSALSRHARFAEISPEVGVLDEEALDRLLADDLTRLSRWWPTWCTRPTNGCAHMPSESPPGS
jgi:hypothetical protein